MYATTTLAGSLLVAACSLDSPEPSVRTGRADRTAATTSVTTSAATTATTTTVTSTTTTSTTDATSTTESTTDPPDTSAAPIDASQPGLLAIAPDDVTSAFLPGNPDLVAASLIATAGRDANAFLAEVLTLNGMAPALIVSGAPITRWSYEFTRPVFDGDGVTSADVVAVNHRFALQIENDDVDTSAEGLRDEFEAVISTWDPVAQITETIEGVLGQPVFGFTVGTTDQPTMTVTVGQHYLIVPRFVDEPLLAV